MKSESSLARAAAAVIHRAVELSSDGAFTARMEDALVGSDVVNDALADTLGSHDMDAQKLVVRRLAVWIARDVLDVWSDVYPDRTGPMEAVDAAEKWEACPCTRHADLSALASRGAARQAWEAWRIPPKTSAWAARTAAWAADAPKHGWQSVAALDGACKATSVERVVQTATRFLTKNCRTA